MLLTKQRQQSQRPTGLKLDQLHEETLCINSLRRNEVDVIVLFRIDFCSLSKISRLLWAYSTSIYDTVLQRDVVLMSCPRCTWVTFHIVEHIEAFVTEQTVSNNLICVIFPGTLLRFISNKLASSSTEHYN